jgi:hypothetical protein
MQHYIARLVIGSSSYPSREALPSSIDNHEYKSFSCINNDGIRSGIYESALSCCGPLTDSYGGPLVTPFDLI